MIFEDSETLQMYVEESLEHLSNIEDDLLIIEDHGKNINEELVNSVFRAAHSIKGGSGFMGLGVIKELSHNIENVLGMIRTRAMVPKPGKKSLNTIVKISHPDIKIELQTLQFNIDQAEKNGKFIYLIEYDMIKDFQSRDKKLISVRTRHRFCFSNIVKQNILQHH